MRRTNLPAPVNRGEVTARSPADPLRIIFKRVRQGLYSLCGAGIVGVVTGSFVVALTPLAIFAAVVTALLLGVLGILVEVVENSREGGTDA